MVTAGDEWPDIRKSRTEIPSKWITLLSSFSAAAMERAAA
jgi:hypothetical protein